MYSITDYLEHYKALEKWAYTKYDDGVSGIEQYHPDKTIKRDVGYFRRVRNVLAHNPNGTTQPLIELTDEFKEKFETLRNKLMNNIAEISIPFKDIYKREISDKVMPTISVMKEKSYSYVQRQKGLGRVQ